MGKSELIEKTTLLMRQPAGHQSPPAANNNNNRHPYSHSPTVRVPVLCLSGVPPQT